MSTTTAVEGNEEHHAHDHHVPNDMIFVKTAIILAIVTAVEVAWSYIGWPEGSLWTVAEVGGLLLMMGYKFFVVASVFMHLRYDSKLLTWVFYGGLALAVAVYLIVLLTLEFFSSATPGWVG